jgi:hypothetical protein
MVPSKLFFLSTLWIVISSCTTYQEYQPRIFDGDKIITKPELLTSQHEKNLVHVLDFYGVEWKRKNDKIYIDSEIDEVLMWNFTTKANDSAWLRTHELEICE